MKISHVFFDVGGVLGTGGWDADQRARAADQFGLDPADFDRRHAEVDEMWEDGRMTLGVIWLLADPGSGTDGRTAGGTEHGAAHQAAPVDASVDARSQAPRCPDGQPDQRTRQSRPQRP